MKTLVAVSIFALALSGCAPGYYHRGYTGYNNGYMTNRYYDNYGGYYRPGTSISIERYYSSPRFSPPHHEHDRHHDDHSDWRPPLPMFDHRGPNHTQNRWGHRDGSQWRGDHQSQPTSRHEFDGPSRHDDRSGSAHPPHHPGSTHNEGRRHFPGR